MLQHWEGHSRPTAAVGVGAEGIEESRCVYSVIESQLATLLAEGEEALVEGSRMAARRRRSSFRLNAGPAEAEAGDAGNELGKERGEFCRGGGWASIRDVRWTLKLLLGKQR